ncbi:glycosyltransferase [Sphingomonas sp. T1]|uniref:glycosyltransferase n=1 Tax=Sphingomonas sp. T1 TaxID=2653172 RepID=UPI001F271B4D|nr:glycosyltransferase family 2 protein [Sphingomonas sp. T1]
MIPVFPLRAVVVLYHPDDGAIDMVLAIASHDYAPVVVANAIDSAKLARLRGAGIDLIVNATNIGLAAAFNQGIDRALASGAAHVMLLDQDTRPAPDMATRLLALASRVEASGRRLGCIGPVPVDRKMPDARTLAATITGGVRDADLAEVATIISSGMVIPRAAIEAVGGMWDELFIDQIDHEWCFRASAAGFAVIAATSVPMPHDMGDHGIKLFGRYKPVHRSPVRHFHIVRNTLWLARCSFIPRRWRLAETVKLAARIPSYILFSSARSQTLRAVARGVSDGMAAPPGRTLSSSPARTSASSIS